MAMTFNQLTVKERIQCELQEQRRSAEKTGQSVKEEVSSSLLHHVYVTN